ncbi:hypothetical protein AMAG_19561 [Allomyces macrogynus ATCC 38327]|uniref:Uncharacterized protein n=1 Tax=Allomyces macrogynus (strain ATCC 38327) TaxID=578462 RepID=A0A0L0SXD4_ALLM3|nr:hypothetical protein AMAG_19561 [Allomyces macrogynus ATCC 38327]|eukprot:KNE66989.1 hypothetical protein AMAG_19561 [Allomyces macrogynus ATCC 38327]
MIGRRQSAPAPAPARATSSSVYASPRILQPAPPPAPAHLAPLAGTPSSSLTSNGKPAKSPKKSAMARLKSRIGRNKTSPPSAPAPPPPVPAAPATVPHLRVRVHKRPGVAIPPIKQHQGQQPQLNSPQVRAVTPGQQQQQQQQAQQAAYQAQQQYAQRNMATAIPSPVAPPPPGPPKINWAPPNLQTPGLPPNARGNNPISPPWLRKMSSDQSMTPSMTSLMSPYGTFHPAIEFAPASSEASGPPSDDEHDDAFRRGIRGVAGPSRGIVQFQARMVLFNCHWHHEHH